MKKKVRKLLKNKNFIIVCVLVLIGIICLILLKNVLYPSSKASFYGNRLDGIENVEFNKKSKNKILEEINKNEVVTSSKINVHGKIINIIFNVNKDVSIDDAKNIGNNTLNSISDEVKSFYDIQLIITKDDEEGTKVQTETGEEKIKKDFPIMGYKNYNAKEFVW